MVPCKPSVQSLLFTAEHLFIQTFWQTVNREWPDIDGLRLDKYHMVRAGPQPLYSGLGAGRQLADRARVGWCSAR